jgi:transposase InsO family protein
MDVQFLPKLPTAKGFDYKISLLHVATRLKYSEIHDNQRSATLAQVLVRAQQRLPPFATVYTDNQAAFTMARTHWPHRITAFTRQCQALGIEHVLIPVASPWRNGFIERSNRTDKEMVFAPPYVTTNEERRYHLALWELEYNTRRPHQGIANHTPIQRCAKIHPIFAATCALT